VSGQLIEANAGTHLWANRFDEALDDIFELQDRITTDVVNAIAPEIERAEIDRARRKPTKDLNAYDFYLRGIAAHHVRPITKSATMEARDLLARAVEIDPDFAPALAYLSWIGGRLRVNGWADPVTNASEAVALARRALSIDPTDPEVLIRAGWSIGSLGQRVEEGLALLEEGVRIDANHALGWTWIAALNAYLGKHDVALDRVQRALRLSPRDPQRNIMISTLANSLFYQGRYHEALSHAEEVLGAEPNQLSQRRLMIASFALLSRLDEATAAAGALLSIDPTTSISGFLGQTPYRRAEDRARIVEGLRLAGIPE
jgi:tetratricopeptide (TPR) repeat protein